MKTILGFMLTLDPFGSLPMVVNDPNLGDDEVGEMLAYNAAQQSPGIQRAMDAIRTEDDRPVSSVMNNTMCIVLYSL
jgi:hypothetical protein